MLEAVHGVGALLKEGWKPKRTILFCSWDAEEEGLIGSTEWVEQHAQATRPRRRLLQHRCGRRRSRLLRLRRPLAQAIHARNHQVRSQPHGRHRLPGVARQSATAPTSTAPATLPPQPGEEVRVSDLGSGSDFTPFLQHVGVPSTDIGSGGPYGVYHSVFDNYAWFVMNADPHFVYLQQMARVFGLEAMRMADTDVLPYDYAAYAREDEGLHRSRQAQSQPTTASLASISRRRSPRRQQFAKPRRPCAPTAAESAGTTSRQLSTRPCAPAETALLAPAGLPNRPWYKHTIYAPGEYTGYAAVVIPGVNEAIEAKDSSRALGAARCPGQALGQAAQTLETAH